MIKILDIILFSSLIFLGGCKISNDYQIVEKSSKTSVLVIGVENGKKFGKCPGSKLDSNGMYNLLKQYTDNIVLLQDSAATKSKVVDELKNVVTNDLAIIYYSGHGGSYDFNDEKSKLEEDGIDEFLCLYDDYLRDDDVWDIISQSSGRIFLIFDCCHSQTMFKLNAPPIFKRSSEKNLQNENKVNMLCWSGCEDSAVSYGASNGGIFTNTILTHFKPNMSYYEFWKVLENEQALKQYENIQQTKLGDFDLNAATFK